MNKLLLTAGICVSVGLVLALVGFGLSGFTLPQIGKHETNGYEISEPFSAVSIDTTVADVRIVLREDEPASVVCGEREKMRHTVSVQDGALTISFEDTRPWYERILSFGRIHVTVYLPKASYETLTVHLDTGDVTVPEGFVFRTAAIESDTGNIDFHANTINDLSVQTDTGNITASGLQSETVQLNTDTGRITLTDSTCSDLEMKTSTGDVKLRNTVVFGKITANTSTGDVRLEQSDAREIFIKTSTGNVSGTLLSEKVFIPETDTGKIRVPKTTTGGKCEIITNTGNITFESVPIPDEVFQTAPLPDEIPE